MQADEVARDFLELGEALGGIADGVEGFNPRAQFGDEDAAKGFEYVFAAIALFEFVALLDDALDGFLPGLVAQPFLVAAVPPFGEVLAGDAFAVEQCGKDLLNVGKAVEPFEYGRGEFGVLQAAIEFFADFPRDTGNFSISHKVIGDVGYV